MAAEEGRALGEFDRIATYFRPLATGPGALGLLDDAALLSVPADRELVVTTDSMVAGVHFLPDDPPDLIARKLLRVNLSDLAAMGADPLAYTLTTALPQGLPSGWLGSFADGLGQDQRAFGLGLVGGDSVSTAGPVVLGIAAFGTVPKGQALRRGGAAPGDAVYVTGTVGDAALALEIVYGRLDVPSTAAAALMERLRLPEPRVTVGTGLRGLASAAMDISDGLAADARHIATASGVGIEIDAPAVPLSPAARALVSEDPRRLEILLTAGDDYELLFTVPPGGEDRIGSLAAQVGVALTRIGRVVEGQGAVLRDRDGRALELRKSGWTHF